MKKLFLVFLVAVLCVLASCKTQESVKSYVGNIIGGAHPSPPETITLQSVEELENILKCSSLTESELSEFLAKDTYSQTGIRNSADIHTLAFLTQTAGYPKILEHKQVDSFTATYDLNQLSYKVNYRINGIRYRFVYTVFTEVAERSNMVPVTTHSIDGETIALYQGTDCLVGELYANDYQIRIIVTNYTSIDDISFEPFQWSCDMVPISSDDHVSE